MNMPATQPDKSANRIRPIITLVAILIVAGGGAAAVWQYQRTASFKTQKADLSTQLASLQQQKSKLQAARVILTANWKLVCDEHNDLCFQVPPDWSQTTFDETTDGIGALQSSSPTGLLTVSYRNHYIKDGAAATFHVSSITSVPDSSLGLQIVGGYYVAENRQPFYIIVGSEQVSNFGNPLKVGTNVVWGNTERFGVSSSGTSVPNDEIQFTIYPTKQTFSSAQSADAWFDSVNGLTALQIMKSLVNGSTYTGKYLDIPELGIRVKLTYNTAGAYYAVRNSSAQGQPPYALLSVHSLDQYSGCTTSQRNDGVAGISTFTKGETDPVYGDFGKTFPNAPLINGRYYFVTGDQYDCTEGGASALHSNVRHDFINAYSPIGTIPKN